MNHKECSKCGEVKRKEEFSSHKSGKDGLRSWCKKCLKEYKKKYYEENKEKIKERVKTYRKENKEKRKEYDKKYYEENKEKHKEYKKKHYKENKKKYDERIKTYRKKNKEKIQEYYNKYKKNNIININLQQYNAKTASPELKPALETLILIRNKKNIIKGVKIHEKK